MDQNVKVIFRLEQDEDGYPPEDVESLWGVRRADGVAIDNVPWFVKGVSLGDVVSVVQAPDGAFEFERVVRRSGHSTYRILLLNPAVHGVERTIEELTAMGLAVEEDAGLLAVDVPPTVSLDSFRKHLLVGVRSGRWEAEEGHSADR
jgi:Domain of unknown function (DUF4265)